MCGRILKYFRNNRKLTLFLGFQGTTSTPSYQLQIVLAKIRWNLHVVQCTTELTLDILVLGYPWRPWSLSRHTANVEKLGKSTTTTTKFGKPVPFVYIRNSFTPFRFFPRSLGKISICPRGFYVRRQK